MELIITFLISMMPLLAMAPLAIAAILVVGLLVSPRLRDALAEGVRGRGARRVHAAPDEIAALQREIGVLRAAVVRAEERVTFLERVLPARVAEPPSAAPSTAAPPS